MRSSSASDIWSKAVTLIFLWITSLSHLISINGEINAHRANSVTWSLDNSTDFRHVSGQDNVVTNASSRANSVMMPFDYHALLSSQDQNTELQDILKHGSALQLERVHIPRTAVNIYCDTFTI